MSRAKLFFQTVFHGKPSLTIRWVDGLQLVKSVNFDDVGLATGDDFDRILTSADLVGDSFPVAVVTAGGIIDSFQVCAQASAVSLVPVVDTDHLIAVVATNFLLGDIFVGGSRNKHPVVGMLHPDA